MLDSPGCMWLPDGTYELVNTPVEFAALVKEKMGHDAAKFAQSLIDSNESIDEQIKDVRKALEALKAHICDPANKVTRTYILNNIGDIIETLEA
jgi:predicted PP-loop superfamily ATPase